MSYESVHELFSRMAEKYGPQAAIDRGGQRVSYAELETQSNRLANCLLDQGVSSGTMVGLFTDDPVQVVTGILGVLKVGGVFVPLDPTFPQQRLQVMSAQVQPAWYVTERKHVEKLGQVWSGAAKVICVDEYAQYERIEHPGVASDPEAPCSIYFTSGSTGRPKAILGRLKGIDHFVRWEIEALGVTAGTRVSQLASPSFDGFLKDVFVPLCAGGVVCAPESRSIVLEGWRLADWLDIEQVEILHCVPSVFRSLLNAELNDKYFEAMRYVVLAGEVLYTADVKRWMDIFGERIRLANLYGPTETTILKFFHFVKPEDTDKPSIPIGKPLNGATVMLINSRGQLCREETVGEIHIKTPYRAHGYYGEPELTKNVFIQNPFNNDPADIIYKTGDYGRLLKGGDLEFLGRRDQQVQVRGVRVELGEIENLLRAHKTVADVAVIDRDDEQGNKYLVAYVTMNNGTGSEHLRQYLSESLPETMVPSAFVELDQLPRTLNGKIDRKALPALERLQAEKELRDARPQGPVEEIVAGIWSEVLRLPAIGRHGNFFNLGGHSLLVTQVLSRVREFFKVELPVRSLFETPTIEGFAQLIQEQVNAGKQVELTSIGRVSREGELPLSHSQQRMWFFEQLASGSGAFHIALGLRLKGHLNVTALEQTFGEIMRRHEGLRTVFPAVNDQPVQIIQPPTQFHLLIADLSRLEAAEAEWQANRLAQEETLRRFDLDVGPLVRPTLLRLSADEHVIICTMHHIIGDGESMEVIIAEMSQLYSAFVQGRQSELVELSVQYVDYAAWQRQWLTGDVLEQRLEYWRRQLAGAPERLSLPQRRVRPKVQGFGGARHYQSLTTEQTEALRELSRREGLSLFMTTLAGFVLMLSRYTGDEDIVVGSTYANRERAEAERLIGMLTITLMLRVTLNGTETFRDILKQVRDVCLDAYAYQVPPELLREDLAKRGEERDRLFDVWFQFEKQRKEKFEMSGLETVPYMEATEVSRFELSMILSEREQELAGMLEYDEDIFTAKATAQMFEDYFRLLGLMAVEPDRQISTISLARNDEIEELSSAFVANLEV
ncbi:MAG TPA: amino acid adenylation domain-containing protein [Pyrinomonadaceae bacterium]|nr:amino acid adenylation domain-containing protein [Pyrinomonadaceae bacterium]